MKAFLDVGERQTPNPRKVRTRATEKHNDKLHDDLLQEWRRWRRERLDLLLTGPHGDATSKLSDFLDSMTIEQASDLLEFVKQGPWQDADQDARFEVLHLVGAAIVRLRERHELPPFDDSLPDEPPTVFEIVREMLR